MRRAYLCRPRGRLMDLQLWKTRRCKPALSILRPCSCQIRGLPSDSRCPGDWHRPRSRGYEMPVSTPAVSFIVPAYKLAHLLPECLASILGQSFEDYEIVVMDDCSPDDTASVVAAFADPRIRYIRNDPNLGHLRNYNKGIGLARGRYVWLISADDRLRGAHAIERFVTALDRHPRAGFVFCPAMRLESGIETRITAAPDHRPADTIFQGPELLQDLLACNFIASPAGMVRKRFYERYGAFPLDLPHAGDWYLWCLFALHGEVAYVSEPLVNYRVHSTSMNVQLATHQAHVVVNDDLEVRWRIKALAEQAGLHAIARRALATLVQDYAMRWREGRELGASAGLTDAQLRRSIEQHVGRGTARRLTARVYAAAGDQSYWRDDYAGAREAYAAALREYPWAVPTWVKQVLLMLGPTGSRLRSLPALARRSATALPLLAE